MTDQTIDRSAPSASAGQPYDGVRVLDLTHHYGVYAGRLFADLGAEVIRVEPPGGLPDRVAFETGEEIARARFVFFSASKKSVVVDFNDPAGWRRFEHLARSADIVFLERGGPLYDRIGEVKALNPKAVITAVSPYGLTGPLADAPASDLTLQAAGGIAWMSGRIDDAPLSLPFEQATMVGSIYAATVTAISFYDAERTGAGHLIDVSVQEAIAHSLQNALQVWDLEHRVSIRGGEGTRDASEDIFPCKDGYVFLAAPLALGTSWKSLVAWIVETGHASAGPLTEERWGNREWRLTREAREDFRRLFVAFTMGYDKDTITEAAIKRRIVMGPVNRVSDLFDDIQLDFRKFWGSLPGPDGGKIRFPGAPYKMTPDLWSVSPAPALGANDDENPENPS